MRVKGHIRKVGRKRIRVKAHNRKAAKPKRRRKRKR